MTCKLCDEPRNTIDPRYIMCDSHYREYKTAMQRKTNRSARADALAALAPMVCRSCGYDADVRALQIDHVRSNGAHERRIRSQRSIHRRVLTYPEDYQLLCANCNWIKRFDMDEVVHSVL